MTVQYIRPHRTLLSLLAAATLAFAVPVRAHAPPKTPSTIANRISSSIAEAVKQPEVVKRMLELSFEAIGGTPAEMALLLKQETERWGKVVRITGAKAD